MCHVYAINQNEWTCRQKIILHYGRKSDLSYRACAFSFQATNRAGFAPAARKHLKRATRRLRISVWRLTARSCFNWKTPTSRRTASVTSSFALWESSARRWRSPYVWAVCPLCLYWCSSLVSEEMRLEGWRTVSINLKSRWVFDR